MKALLGAFSLNMGLLHDCETSNFAKVSLQLYMIYCDNTPGMLTWLQHLSIMSPPSLGTRLLPQGCSELQWIAVKPTWRVHIVVMGQRGTPSFPPSFSYNEWKICMCMNITLSSFIASYTSRMFLFHLDQSETTTRSTRPIDAKLWK